MDTEKPLELKLEEIKSSKPHAIVNRDEDTLTIGLPYGCRIDAERVGDEWKISWVSVPRELEGHGIGTRLIQAAVSAAKNLHGRKLTGFVTSPRALHIRKKVFGEDNLRLHDAQGKPVTFSEAVKLAADRENEDYGVEVEADLSLIDNSKWEKFDIKQSEKY